MTSNFEYVGPGVKGNSTEPVLRSLLSREVIMIRFALLSFSAIVCFAVTAQNFGVGEIIDTVRTSENDHTFSLYLPSEYTNEKEYPLVLFFEPVARGRLPLELYKGLAEKYEIILACSNESRNFLPPVFSLRAAEAILSQVFEDLSVNRGLVITSGFSGGSRASMMVATQTRVVTGIIGIGAVKSMFADHLLESKHGIPYAGIAGNRDFNYAEHYEAEQEYKGLGIPNIRLIGNHEHDWATPMDYEIALIWMLSRLDPTRSESILDPGLINQYLVNVRDSISALDAYRIGEYFKNDFALELTDLGIDEKSIRKDEKKLDQAIVKENRLRNQLKDSIELALKGPADRKKNSALNWVLLEGKSMNRAIEVSKSKGQMDKYAMYRRVLTMAAGVGRESHEQALLRQDFESAKVGVEIWTLRNPNENYLTWTWMRLYAQMGDVTESLNHLDKLIAAGFKRGELLKADPSFDILKETPQYKQLVQEN